MRIFHVITSLEAGGAQTMMVSVISRLEALGHEANVIGLGEWGPVGDGLRELGVPVAVLDKLAPRPLRPAALVRAVRRARPDLIQTWLYRGDLAGSLCRVVGPRPPLVWGVHATDPLQQGRGTSALVRLNAMLSRYAPTRIVYCSNDARRAHERHGYDPRKSHTIANGVDTERFRPDEASRRWLRAELGLAPDTVLIGLVSRFHPIKDHRTFFAAAGELHGLRPGAHFVLCGDGIDPDNATLAGYVRDAEVGEVTHLLGPRGDTERITAALDVATSTSVSESFSLTLAEALACGVNAVSTDTGGPRELLGGHGRLVPVADPKALCDACHTLVEMPPETRTRLGENGRQHVVRHYSLDKTSKEYLRLYTELVG